MALALSFPGLKLSSWGAILMAFGLAHLVYWYARGQKEWDEAQVRDAEIWAAWMQRHSEPGITADEQG